MNDMLKSLLSGDGPLSSIRVMGFVSLFAGIGLAWYGIAQNRDMVGLAALCSVFVASAFAAKTVSKFAEAAEEKKD